MSEKSVHRAFVADVVGNECTKCSAPRRLDAGEILCMMDLLASIIAARHAQSMVTTASFDQVTIVRSIFHGDFIRLEGELVYVGNSSMIIQITGYRHDVQKDGFLETHSALVTMVSIEKDGRPKKGLPRLSILESSRQWDASQMATWKALNKAWHDMQVQVDQMSTVTLQDIGFEDTAQKMNYVSISSTTVEVQGCFLPKHVNAGNTVFGGEFLKWMDTVALLCAKKFTKNMNMVTISMNRISFKRPFHLSEVAYMQATICNVRQFTVEIQVQVFAIQPDMTYHLSHTGYFIALNLGHGDVKFPIVTGLDLQNATALERKMYLKAQKRSNFNFKHSCRPKPLGVSETLSKL